MVINSRRETCSLDTTCITIAKAASRRTSRGTSASCYSRRPPRPQSHLKHVQAEYCSEIARSYAKDGQLDRAEGWFHRARDRGDADTAQTVRALNAMILAEVNDGNVDKAESLLKDAVGTPVFYPELLGTRGVDNETFDLLVQAQSQAHNVREAEKHLMDMIDNGFRPALKSFVLFIRACVDKGEARRGHRWCETLVEQGSARCPRYAPTMLRMEMSRCPESRSLDIHGLLEVIEAVAKALADLGNTVSANRWLQYLSDCGVRPSDAHVTWNRVRAAHPLEIVPAVLSAENEKGHPVAASTRPPRLGGERRWDSNLKLSVGLDALSDGDASTYLGTSWPSSPAMSRELSPSRPSSRPPSARRPVPAPGPPAPQGRPRSAPRPLSARPARPAADERRATLRRRPTSAAASSVGRAVDKMFAQLERRLPGVSGVRGCEDARSEDFDVRSSGASSERGHESSDKAKAVNALPGYEIEDMLARVQMAIRDEGDDELEVSVYD